MEVYRSPFFYVGDKFKLIPQLKQEFPNNIETFVEPFCGGGSVFLNVQASKYMLNDANSYMIKLHKFLSGYKNNGEKFISDLTHLIKHYKLSASFIDQLVPIELKKKHVKTYYAHFNKQSYAQMKNDFNSNQDDMLLLYLLLIYGFNRMLRFNSSGKFNLPVGNVDFNKNVVKAIEGYFKSTNTKPLEFFNLDFERFLEELDLKDNDFVYLDPPYLITSSEYNKGWGEQEEKRLLDLLDKLDSKNVRFAISNVILHKGRHNLLFEEWSEKYKVVEVKSNYISYHDNSEKKSREVLVKNY
jgi:DNA adenine methylase